MRLLLLGSLAAVCGCSDYDYVERTFTDDFVQASDQGAADVLFVVDDSASMSEEQGRLQANFASFTDALVDSYADFQLGVVTTDVTPGNAGVLRGGVMTPDTPDLVAAVIAALDVGTRGSRDEEGLAAAADAIDPATNPGFHRRGAHLHIVVFSDEDDHSPGDVEDWLGAYEDATGNEAYSVHAVVGDLPEGCASGTSAADPGKRYLAAALNSGGYRASICADDYSDILTHVGLSVGGLTDTFPLTQLPKPETIEVTVDGVTMPNRDVDGWTYSPGDNAVHFAGRAVPRPGMGIGVTYQPLVGGGDTDAG